MVLGYKKTHQDSNRILSWLSVWLVIRGGIDSTKELKISLILGKNFLTFQGSNSFSSKKLFRFILIFTIRTWNYADVLKGLVVYNNPDISTHAKFEGISERKGHKGSFHYIVLTTNSYTMGTRTIKLVQKKWVVLLLKNKIVNPAIIC